MLKNKKITRANLFIIGISKCGSSWLHFYLDTHPDIFMSKQAELFFFGDRYPEDLEDYHSNFPFEEGYKYFGESTPLYYLNPEVAKQIKEYSPDAKIIVIVRDPVQRLLSRVYYAKQLGNIQEKKSPNEIFADLRQQPVIDSHYERYLPSFEKYFDTESFKILSLEEAKMDIESFNKELCGYLHIDNKFSTEILGHRSKNATGSKMFRILYRITIRPIKCKFPKLYKYLLKSGFMKVTKEFLLKLLGKAKKEQISDELYRKLQNEFLPTYDYLHKKGFKDVYEIKK
ncbi:MAG: sulfotransferase [bacterium]